MQNKIERLGHAPLGVAPPRFVMMQRVDGAGAGFAPNGRKHFVALAPTQDQPRTFCAQLGIKACKAVMQPPARGAPHAPVTRRGVIKHIDRDYRPCGGGRTKCGLV